MIQMTIKPIRIALTGGPGVGKSTVLDILFKQGYKIVPEAARIIIEQEMHKDSDCLPWKNLQRFQNAVSDLQFELENSAEGPIIFSDRGIVDGYAYSRVDKIIVPEVVLANGRNRYQAVFILNPLPNYQTDESRKEDIKTAKILHEAINFAYIEFGYNPIQVPVLPPEERSRFILSKLEKITGTSVVDNSTT
jgi:predicted ATPase